MKATLRMSRKALAIHNDRTFGGKADHIDSAKSKNNKYKIFSDDPMEQAMTFLDYELHFYQKYFGASLERVKENYRKQRKLKEDVEMDKWLTSRRYRPMEMILQVGDRHDNIGADDFEEIVHNFIARVINKYDKMVPLSMGIHVDEASPHAHVRWVFVGHDKYGNLQPNCDSALCDMGVGLPQPDTPESGKNNRLMTLTKELREMWYDTIERNDIVIDRVPDPYRKWMETIHPDVLDQYEKEFKEQNTAHEAELQRREQEHMQQLVLQDEQYRQKKAEKEKLQKKLDAEIKQIKDKATQIDKYKSVNEKWPIEYKKSLLDELTEAKKAEKKTKDKLSDANQKIKELKRENDDLRKKVPSFEEEKEGEILKYKGKLLEKIKNVVFAFLKEMNLLAKFVEFCKKHSVPEIANIFKTIEKQRGTDDKLMNNDDINRSR